MLHLKAKHQTNWKCPLHPRMQYGPEGDLPASCSTCLVIWQLYQKRLDYDRAERITESAIARHRLTKGSA